MLNLYLILNERFSNIFKYDIFRLEHLLLHLLVIKMNIKQRK
jgi:hypothetical protein